MLRRRADSSDAAEQPSGGAAAAVSRQCDQRGVVSIRRLQQRIGRPFGHAHVEWGSRRQALFRGPLAEHLTASDDHLVAQLFADSLGSE